MEQHDLKLELGQPKNILPLMQPSVPLTERQTQRQEGQREGENVHQMELIPLEKKVVNITNKNELPNLISGHIKERRNDETIKRPSPGQYLSPQCNKNQQTRQDVRMKILIENNRLKASVQTLKKDIDNHRFNEVKIAQILKQSKQRIFTFKQIVKDKSKKISQITSKNIELRSKNQELQQRINQLNSYSIWQQNQITSFKKQIYQKNQQQSQQKYLQEKIDKLQAVLKSYEVSFSKPEEKDYTISNRSELGQIQQISTHSKKNSQKWGTMNELELKDIQGMKQKQSHPDQQLQKLNEINNNLKMRINQLESQLEVSRRQFNDREEQWKMEHDKNESKLDILQDEIGLHLKKSLTLDEQLLKKDHQISNLKRENAQLQQELIEKKEQIKSVEGKLTEDIASLNIEIDIKQKNISELKTKLKELQNASKKQVAQLEDYIQLIQDSQEVKIKEYEEKNTKLNAKINQLQYQLDDYVIKTKILEDYKIENEQTFRQTGRFRQEHVLLQQEVNHLQKQIQLLKTQNNHLACDLHLAYEQKNDYIMNMNKTNQQIDLLKLMITKNSQNQAQGVIKQLEQEQYLHQNNIQKTVNGPIQSHNGHQFVTRPLEEQPQLTDEQMNEPHTTSPQKYQTKTLKEQPQLEEQEPPRRSSRRSSKRSSHRSILHRSGDKSSQISRLKKENQDLQKLAHTHRMEVIEIKYHHEQQLQKLKEQIENLKTKQEIYFKNFQQMEILVNQKQKQFEQFKIKVAKTQAHYEEQVVNLKSFIANQTEEIKGHNKSMIHLQINFQKQKQTRMKMSAKIQQLQSFNEACQTQKLNLQKQNQELKQQYELMLTSNQMMISKRMEQLQSKYNEKIEEDKMNISQQLEDKNKQAAAGNLHKIFVLEGIIAQLNEHLSKSNSEKEKISEQYQKLKENLNDLESEKNSLQVEYKNSQQEYQKLKQSLVQMDELKQCLQEANKNNKGLLNQNKLLLSELQVYKCEQQSIKAENNSIKSKMSLIQNQLTSSRRIDHEVNYELRQRISKYQQIIEDQKKQLQIQFENKENLKIQRQQEIQKKQYEIHQLKKNNQDISAQFLILEIQGENLKNIQKQKEEQNEKLRQKNQYLNKQYNSLEAEKQKIEVQLNKLHEINSQQSLKIIQHENNLGNMRVSLTLTQTQVSQKNNILQTISKQKQSQITNKMTQIQTLKHNIEQLKQQVKKLHQKQELITQQFNKQKEELQQERQALVSQNYQSFTRIQQLQQSLNKQTQTVKIHKEQIQQKSQSIINFQNIIKSKSQESQLSQSKNQQLQEKLQQLNKLWIEQKQNWTKDKEELEDNLQVYKKMNQQMQEENQIKIMKLNKQLSNYKVILESAQKQTSFQLQQSNRSMNEMQTQLKIHLQTINQKDQDIKQLKDINTNLKEELNKIKVGQQRFTEQKQNWSKQRKQTEQKLGELAQEVLHLKKQINLVKIKEDQLKEQKIFTESALQNLKSRLKEIEMLNEHLQEQKDKHNNEYDTLKQDFNNLQQENIRLRQQFDTSETSLKQLMIENKKLEYRNEMNEQNISKMKQSLRTIEQERQHQMSQSRSLQEKTQSLQQDNEQLNLMLTSIEKDFQNKIENLKSEHRQDYLGMERKYGRQMDELCQQLNLANNEKDKMKQQIDLLKKTQKQLKDELQFLQKKLKRVEQSVQEFDNERGEITDKVLQLTQENNDFQKQIESLRSELLSKDDQIFLYKEQIDTVRQEYQRKASQSEGSKNLKISIDTDRMALEEMIEKLEAINRQFLAKNQILQTQIDIRLKTQRQLNEQLEAFKARQSRERHNSTDSWITKSKVFNDEKSQNLQTQLETLKLKLESAQAYIAQLQDQCQQYAQKQNASHLKELETKIKTLEKENQDLKMKVEYQDAYIDHLENDNINASIVSKRSVTSKIGKPKFLNVDKDHSVVSMEQSNRIENYEDNRNLLLKVNMITEFLESYQKNENSGDRQEELRKKLNNHTLDELLNTIFYKIQRDSIKLREKETELSELQMELEQYEQQLKASRKILEDFEYKASLYDSVQQKYQQTRKMLEDALIIKMQQQAQLAQNRRHIEELERLKLSSSQERSRNQNGMTASKRARDALTVLKEENQDESSGSMMSADAQSQIPSEMYKSKQVSQGNKGQILKNTLNDYSKKQSLHKALSIEKQFSAEYNKMNIDFLSKVLDEIDNIESNMAYIEVQLEEKGQVLQKLVNAEKSNIKLVSKLEELQSKMTQNGKQMNIFFQKTQLQLLAIIKESLKERQREDNYGFQSQSRRKIQQYLNLLQAELTKSNKYEEDRQGASIELKRNNIPNPSMLKMSLQQIKQDIINEDKGSSFKGSLVHGLHSHSNSQGVDMFDPLEIKKQNSTLNKEIQNLQEQLFQKQKVLKIIDQRFQTVSKEIGLILDDILLSFQQNQYLIDQFQNIKLYLSKVFTEQSLSNNPNLRSSGKIDENSKMVLVQSKLRNSNNSEIKKGRNMLEELLKINQQQLYELAEQLNNEQVRSLQKKIQEVVLYQYEDCMDFLINEESLILDILKMSEQQSVANQTMEKLAHKFSRQQIAHIITNSHNKVQARNTLKRVLSEEMAKSQISDQNDFSPDPEKMQEIRQRISPNPTELILTLHNHLLHILAAPTRQVFYDLIEQFYKSIHTFENQIKQEMDEIDSRSQSNSLRIKKMLENSYQNLDFSSMQKFSILQGKNIKNRSTSCKAPQTPNDNNPSPSVKL